MVRKIFGFLYKETNALNQAALLLGLFALLSQILGFLRDRLLAHIFGASVELDIYYVAFRIPDFIFVLAASVVSLSVLVPFIIEKESEGREALRRFVDNVFSFFFILMIIISVLAFFALPFLSKILFKGFSPESLSDVIFISRILLLSPIILGFSNLLGSLTQAYNRFTVYALSPILYNAGIIAGIIFLTGRFGVIGVATGVIMGACLHALIQVPFVIASGLLPRPVLNLDFGSIFKVIKISFPRTLTLSMSQISMLFLISIASYMVSGSISVLSLSFNLQAVPISIIGVSYSLAAFPTLSRRFRENNFGAFLKQMTDTARFIIFWSLPFSALFIVIRAQIVRVILGSGLFDWDATRLTAAAVALFALSSVFQSLLLLFMRGFYSAGFTKKPFLINLVSTGVIVISSYLLVKLFYFSENFRYFISAFLKVGDLSDTVVLMLPLGFSIGTVINCLWHWLAFERVFKGFSAGVLKTLFQSFGASVIIGLVAYLGLNIFVSIFDITTLAGIFLQGLLSGILGISAGIVVLVGLGNKEVLEVWRALSGKFWRAEVIATDPEIV
jgi:putative peptidoglycan lipid II flippase